MKTLAKHTDGWGSVLYFPLLPEKTELESMLTYLLQPQAEKDEAMQEAFRNSLANAVKAS